MKIKKRLTKKQRTGVLIGLGLVCIVAGGLASSIYHVGVDDTFGTNRKAGETVTLDCGSINQGAVVVDGNNAQVKGFFTDGTKNLKYSYTLYAEGSDDFDGDSLSIDSDLEQVGSLKLVIEGYTHYVETVDLIMNASAKKDVTAKVSVGGWLYGSESIGTVADTYTFESMRLHDGNIIITIDNADFDTTFSLSSIVINADVDS